MIGVMNRMCMSNMTCVKSPNNGDEDRKQLAWKLKGKCTGKELNIVIESFNGKGGVALEEFEQMIEETSE